MRETNNKNESGFSLIEMMIAVTVILVGLVAIVGISVYVSRANYTSNALNVLAAAAQDQVDRMRTSVWSTSTEDPTLSVGGSLDSGGYTPATSSYSESSPSTMSATTEQSPTRIYSYTLDPNNPHRATVANTPAGDLNITWQVRQGATPDLRYVTIKVVQINPPRGLENGFTVSTIVVRN
ncbi:MAG: prepilin-type N-terminal cleavage/methylation domain-containing protein [Acidobacteriota bacterium]